MLKTYFPYSRIQKINSGKYLVEFQIVAGTFEIVTCYIYNLIKHNWFDCKKKNSIAVPLEFLLFFNKTGQQL